MFLVAKRLPWRMSSKSFMNLLIHPGLGVSNVAVNGAWIHMPQERNQNGELIGEMLDEPSGKESPHPVPTHVGRDLKMVTRGRLNHLNQSLLQGGIIEKTAGLGGKEKGCLVGIFDFGSILVQIKSSCIAGQWGEQSEPCTFTRAASAFGVAGLNLKAIKVEVRDLEV